MRCLIVDDDDITRELLQLYLKPFADCDTAFDGQAAIDAFRAALQEGHPYGLVCLDIMMPQADGHQTLNTIRDLERQHGIGRAHGAKVIMITALRDSKHCIRAFTEGCESYLPKPVDHRLLLTQVRALLALVRQEAPSSRGSSTAPAAAKVQSARSLGSAHYLIVDDDAVCRALLEAMLSPYGRCSFAYDGQEAIDAVRLALEDHRPYDLICLDIMMPGTNGHEVLRAVRALEAEHGILGSDGVKVIMTTALRDAKHCVQSFREGCESYVTKPIDEQQLLGKMRELGVLESDPAAQPCV